MTHGWITSTIGSHCSETSKGLPRRRVQCGTLPSSVRSALVARCIAATLTWLSEVVQWVVRKKCSLVFRRYGRPSHGEMFSSWLVTDPWHRPIEAFRFGHTEVLRYGHQLGSDLSASLEGKLELGIACPDDRPSQISGDLFGDDLSRGDSTIVGERTLLLSVKPEFAQKLLQRLRITVELRRVVNSCRIGTRRCNALLYATAPTALFVGYCRIVEHLYSTAPTALWPRVRCSAGVTRARILQVFSGGAAGRRNRDRTTYSSNGMISR